MITILEGEAFVYRGAGRVRALEGVRLMSGDIVQTQEPAFAQIELSDGSVLQLGPATSAMLGSTARPRSERWVYVIGGWGKVSGARGNPHEGPVYKIRTPLVDMDASTGVVVFKIAPEQAAVYVERGEAGIAEHSPSRTAPEITLKGEQYYRRKSGVPGTVVRRDATTTATPLHGFVAEMPRAFRDSIPSRIALFRLREVKPAPASDFSYADVQAWLNAEPTVRRQFVQRWRSHIDDRAFREELVAHLSAHPEWDPMLFPEKYLPKEPPVMSGFLMEPRPGKDARSP